MITALGIGTDPTIRHFVDHATSRGAPVRFLDLFDAVTGGWELHLGGSTRSWVGHGDAGRAALDPGGAHYCRLIDLGPSFPWQSAAWGSVISGLSAWLELSAGRVVNRPGHVNDNASKPLHEAGFAVGGFRTPPTLTSSDADALASFAGEGPTVAKALSGQRADCRRVTAADFVDFDARSGPVHLQRYVEGQDVRAHVVGEQVIAVGIQSDQDDYRLDADAAFTGIRLPTELTDAMVAWTRTAGLAFAGWDLRLGADECWTLEINPMPGYSYYDHRVDGRITDALIELLTDTDVVIP